MLNVCVCVCVIVYWLHARICVRVRSVTQYAHVGPAAVFNVFDVVGLMVWCACVCGSNIAVSVLPEQRAAVRTHEPEAKQFLPAGALNQTLAAAAAHSRERKLINAHQLQYNYAHEPHSRT